MILSGAACAPLLHLLVFMLNLSIVFSALRRIRGIWPRITPLTLLSFYKTACSIAAVCVFLWRQATDAGTS
jgi:hypothetical protein